MGHCYWEAAMGPTARGGRVEPWTEDISGPPRTILSPCQEPLRGRASKGGAGGSPRLGVILNHSVTVLLIRPAGPAGSGNFLCTTNAHGSWGGCPSSPSSSANLPRTLFLGEGKGPGRGCCVTLLPCAPLSLSTGHA